MWTEQFESMLMLMVMLALLRASYELSGPERNRLEEVSAFAETHLISETAKPNTITPRQKEWAERAAKNYAEAQEKKWRNWNVAMFEPAK